jgi:hypothetical protein
MRAALGAARYAAHFEWVAMHAGEVCAIAALGPPPNQASARGGGEAGMRDELSAQLSAPPPSYVLVSTAGVLELEKRRPVLHFLPEFNQFWGAPFLLKTPCILPCFPLFC